MYLRINKRFLILLIVLLFSPIFVDALDYPPIDSKIVEIYDLNDKKVIYEVDSSKQTSIASLTKIVTTITAIDNIKNLDEEVVITPEILSTVRWDASKAGLNAGDRLTYRDLLFASMLPSGADATNAIAISSSGSIDKFVDKMNKLVNKLGLKNTHFVNVTGLDDPNHYSTADDVRKILEYALSNDLFMQIYNSRTYTLSNKLVVKTTLFKYNTSSVDISKVMGSKTGYTGEAGYCLSSLSDINSHKFIIIVLNASHRDNKYYNIIDTVNLINFLLDNYNYQVLVNKNDIVKTIPVKLSKIDNYKIIAKEDIKYYLPSDYDKNKIEIKYDGLDHLTFMNKKDEIIGTISYYYDNKLITKEDIILNKDINISIKKVLKEYFYIFIIIPICIIIIVMLFRKKKKRKKKRKTK